MIQSLDRGIKILDILERKKSAGVIEIAKEIKIDKSSAFRLLDTLKANNLVEQDPVSGKYRISGGILRFGNSFLKRTNVLRIARPYLEQLSNITNESAHLCVFSNDRVIVIDQVMSAEIIQVTAKIGKEEVIYCTSVGKVILAYQTEKIREKILEATEFVKFTDNTVKDRQELNTRLNEIRNQGYAVDYEEMTLGVRCAAAPVKNHAGEVNYCIGISGLAARMTDENLSKYLKKLKESAEMISKDLGYTD